MTTKDKIIELLAEERRRSRDIAYSYKHDYDSKVKNGVSSLKWHYEKIADICRQIGNNISGSNALSEGETIQDRIKREYSEELKQLKTETIINYIQSRIDYYSGGDELKSMAESCTDEMIVKELQNIKKQFDDETV
jgi:hypothetical protein